MTTIRSMIRPRLYAFCDAIAGLFIKAVSCALILVVIIFHSPLLIPVAVKAWFDEKPVVETVTRFFYALD